MFKRLVVEGPSAEAKGWIADYDGIVQDSRRGYGGQSRTAARVFAEQPFDRCRLFGWITNVRSRSRGASRDVIEEIIHRLVREGADVIGLMVVPDDDRFVARLTAYYGRFGFRVIEEDGYPVMIRF